MTKRNKMSRTYQPCVIEVDWIFSGSSLSCHSSKVKWFVSMPRGYACLRLSLKALCQAMFVRQEWFLLLSGVTYPARTVCTPRKQSQGWLWFRVNTSEVEVGTGDAKQNSRKGSERLKDKKNFSIQGSKSVLGSESSSQANTVPVLRLNENVVSRMSHVFLKLVCRRPEKQYAVFFKSRLRYCFYDV